MPAAKKNPSPSTLKDRAIMTRAALWRKSKGIAKLKIAAKKHTV